MRDNDPEFLRGAIAALEAQRSTLGDTVLDIALAPLRARLALLQRPAGGLQRRQLTVLFADVVGSTALASSLDAEDTLEMLNGALRQMAALVEAQGGRVLRFTGDGVKAAFGADESREDDAERAVRAGLAILQAGREQAEAARLEHGIADFAVRVGVHTGDVALGAGIEADDTTMGAAVNIAARMEQSAPPGALRISHDAWNHVRGLFDVDAQPPLLVKGIAAPMQTYLVRAARDRRVAHVERGLQGLKTPMVGRQPEWQRLLDAVAVAGRTRQLQALTLLGDAGLGKSRLLRELTHALMRDHTAALPAAPRCQLLTVRAQPDGMLRPWGLLRSLMALQFGVADTDSAEVARQKVQHGLAPCFDERAEQQAQLIGQLSGLDFADSPHLRGLDPRALRDQAFAALRAYLQVLARDTLPVLVVEDLHWADDGSLDLLQHLQAHAAELPLVLVMTARPALLTRRPDWAGADTLVQLQPLAAAHSDTLAQALLQRLAVAPPQLAELVVGRAEGNPYYMEELVRRLIDDGVIAVVEPHWTVQLDRLDDVRLPGTLVGLLQARLDALPAPERLAARQASIIGHIFWDDALQTLDAHAPLALPALQQAAFVRVKATSDFENTTERQFDHHLLHQVTYDTLLKTERRQGHGAVARWLTARTRGRGAEFLAMTGEHAERAGDVTLAVDCFDEAAREARKRFANAAAMSWLRRAVALLAESDAPRRFDLLDRLATITDSVGDRAGQDAVLADMAALLQRHPDDVRLAKLRFSSAVAAERRGDVDASERLSLEAFALAERCGAAHTAASAQGNRAWLRLARQDLSGAAEPLEIGLQWAGRIAAPDLRAEIEVKLLTLSGIIATVLCRIDEAHQTLTAVLARGETLNLPRVQLGALDNLAMLACFLARWDDAIGWAEQMFPLAQATGAAPDLAGARLRLAQAHGSKGDHGTAIRLHEQNLPGLRAVGNRRQEGATLRMLGISCLAQGDAPAALQWHAQAETVYQAVHEALEAGENLADRALCQFRLGQAADALATVDGLLGRLAGALKGHAPHETIELRWACQQVLAAAEDARAGPLLEQLLADVHARCATLTDAGDRERLIQAHPVFRDVVAGGARQGIQNPSPP